MFSINVRYLAEAHCTRDTTNCGKNTTSGSAQIYIWHFSSNGHSLRLQRAFDVLYFCSAALRPFEFVFVLLFFCSCSFASDRALCSRCWTISRQQKKKHAKLEVIFIRKRSDSSIFCTTHFHKLLKWRIVFAPHDEPNVCVVWDMVLVDNIRAAAGYMPSWNRKKTKTIECGMRVQSATGDASR